MTRLLRIANREEDASETSDDPRSHALHILQSLVHDAQLAVEISSLNIENHVRRAHGD